jgi:hypothetical protein
VLRLAAIGAMAVTVTAGGPPEATLFWNALFDVGHVVVFAAITVCLLDVVAGLRPDADPRAAVGWTLAAALALAAGTELVQSLVPNHDAAFRDFARDAAGMTMVLMLRREVPFPRSLVVRRLIVAAIAAAVLTPFAAVARIYLERNRAFPVVIPFSGSSWERRLLSFNQSELVPGGCEMFRTAGADPLVRLAVRPGRYPGFALEEAYPDWRAYRRLVFVAAMDPGRSMALTLRIHDARHDEGYADRFNTTIRLTPGEHRIEIPLDTLRLAPERREIDLGRIRGISVFAYRLTEPRQVCLSAFRLE